MTNKTVAIIGAGVSGLAAGKILLEDGFDVTIFDRQKTLGGIWSPYWAYANLHDTEAMDCAPWQNIHNYLKRYADKFHLIDRIQFQTQVLLIDKDDLRNPNLPWIIKVETATGDHKTFEFDLVVVANGLFSTPEKPNFRGQDKFAGSIYMTLKSNDRINSKINVWSFSVVLKVLLICLHWLQCMDVLVI